MKKFLGIFVILLTLCSSLTAQEQENSDEKFRVEFSVGDSLGTNILTVINSTNIGIEFGTCNNNVSYLAGCIIQEETTFDFDFALFGLTPIPYLGVNLWNNEIIVGVSLIIDDSNKVVPTPYISYSYIFDLIPAKLKSFSNSLQLKVGASWFPSVMRVTSNSTNEGDGLGSALIAAFSLYIPKVNVGIQYQVGKGW